MAKDTITINGRTYRRFIQHPEPVTDGTVRCFACGQIDEPQWHDNARCPATGGALPPRTPEDHQSIATPEQGMPIRTRDGR